MVPEERPDLEQAHPFYVSIRSARSAKSIQTSRMVEIKWRERGGVEWRPWRQVVNFSDALGGRSAQREIERDVVKEFANIRDPTMFAAASNTAVGRVVEYKAVLQNYSMFTFDVTSAYTHAWEDGLVFLEPLPEEVEEHGDCMWRSVRLFHRRRKGAGSWQEHFDAIIRSEKARQKRFDCGSTSEVSNPLLCSGCGRLDSATSG